MKLRQFLRTTLLSTALGSAPWTIAAADDVAALHSGAAKAATPNETSGTAVIAASHPRESTDGHTKRAGGSRPRTAPAPSTGAPVPRKPSVPPKSTGASGVAASPRTAVSDTQGNSGRLRALLSARAHGRVVASPGRRSVEPADLMHRGGARGTSGAISAAAVSTHGAASTPGAVSAPSAASTTPGAISTPGVSRPSLSAGAAQPASRNAARSPAATGPNKTVTGVATLGAPRVVGVVRVGGPATGRTVRGATLDGNQLRHKF